MYIENKSAGLVGPCRIGSVRFSKTGATLYYAGRAFQSLSGRGFKANYFDVETGERYWISGPRRDGADGLYGRITQPSDVDEDVSDAYWRNIRGSAPQPVLAEGLSPSQLLRSHGRADQPMGLHGRKGRRLEAQLRHRRASMTP
jgi:hypothetical protein